MKQDYKKTTYACFIGYIVQAIVNSFVPLSVLQKADVNLLIANACRLWRNSDISENIPDSTDEDHTAYYD